MKIKNKKDIEELQDTISRELGVDITKYRDEEVADNLVDLLVFPKYIVKWIARPVLISFILFIIGFFVIDLVHIQYLIYGIVGLVLFLIVGIFAGVLNLSRKLNEDLESISDYSLGVLKNSMLDIGDVGGRINKNNIKDVVSMLFKGVIHLVTLPMLGKAIDNKVPLASGLVKLVVERSLGGIANRLTFDDENIDESIINVDGESKFVSNYLSTIDKAGKGIGGTLSTVSKIIRTPFRIGLYLALFFLIIFIYLIW